VGFENLMQKAEEIRLKAIDEAILDLGGRRHSGSYMQTKRPEIEAMFADIPSQFEPFTMMPDPASFDGPINDLAKALTKLSTGQQNADPISTNGRIYPANIVLDKMSGSESYVEDWSGTAASEFKTNFIEPFPSVVRNQFTIVAALKSALEAEKAIWLEARKNIWDIADQTYKRLEVMDDCGKNEWTMAFTVVASICAVAAVPISGGASLSVAALTITAVGATAQVVAAVDVKDPPELKIRGEASPDVINSMRDAIRTEIEKIGETERRIRDAISALSDLIYQKRDYFVSKRPTLADATNATIRSDMGYAN
jgi:hypothetical protein